MTHNCECYGRNVQVSLQRTVLVYYNTTVYKLPRNYYSYAPLMALFVSHLLLNLLLWGNSTLTKRLFISYRILPWEISLSPMLNLYWTWLLVSDGPQSSNNTQSSDDFSLSWKELLSGSEGLNGTNTLWYALPFAIRFTEIPFPDTNENLSLLNINIKLFNNTIKWRFVMQTRPHLFYFGFFFSKRYHTMYI